LKNLEGRDQLGDIHVDGRIIMKYILKETGSGGIN
jgi:hypothetical protein